MKRQIKIIACILCLVMILQFAPAIYAAEDTETAEHMIPIESNIVGKQNVLILERDGRYYLSVEDISQLTRSQLQIQENKLFLDHGIRQIVIDKKACKAEDVDVLEYNSAQTSAAKLTEELNNFLAVCGEEHTSASTFLMELYLNLQETQISHGTLLCQLNGILKNTDEVDRISKELNQKLYEHLETKRTVEEIGTFMDACTLALDIAVTSDTLMRYDDSTRKLFANTVNDQILSAAHYNIMFKNITDKIAKNLKSNGKIIESKIAHLCISDWFVRRYYLLVVQERKNQEYCFKGS